MEARIDIRDVSIRFGMAYDRKRLAGERISRWIKESFGKSKRSYFQALSGVTLAVNDGDAIGLIGPNGCGKTTLLRVIAGIYTPDGGSVDCHGSISTLLSLGTGFDNQSSGLDNIRLNGLLLGMRPEEIEAKIPMIAEFAEIGEHINVPMRYYSNGMRGRLSFGIVLAMQPDILLVDEVLSVGDLKFQKKSLSAMHDMLRRAACRLIVTHNLSFVREHCNRAVYMRRGKIVCDGRPEEVVLAYERDFA